jgi:hypothetical protein
MVDQILSELMADFGGTTPFKCLYDQIVIKAERMPDPRVSSCLHEYNSVNGLSDLRKLIAK